MLTTALCTLLDITHPVVLGGMGMGTGPSLVAAVSNAGGLGVQGGCAGRTPQQIAALAEEIRARTGRPFGMNLLLFRATDEQIDAVLAARPAVLSTAWAPAGHDLAALRTRAHDAGVPLMHMVSTLEQARQAADAGADVIVAQGTEGGGHVGLIGTAVLVPMVARAVAPVPVLAAGGLADGAGLAAALLLGAEGALYGTRFLATVESPVTEAYKRAIVACDGHDTLATEIPDVANAAVWPGAYARVRRNRFIQTWAGREGELRYRRDEAAAAARRAYETDDLDHAIVYAGQSAGLIDAVTPAGDVVRRIVEEATELLRERAATLLAG